MKGTFQQGHALVIGVGGDLPSTVEDAKGLAEILRDTGWCAYPESQVDELTDAQATRAGILDKLIQLAQRTTPEATVVFYFSGHGYELETPGGRAYFIIPSGCDLERLNATAISGVELTERLGAIPARRMLILLDCCHAGGLDAAKAPGGQFTKTPLPAETAALLAQGSGRVIIASSKAGELSYAGIPYSAFTLALIEGLAGQGAAKQDGFVRVADLALYAREMVPKRTMNKQHPILHFEAADNFTVAYYAGGEQQPKALPFTGEPQIESEPGAFRLQQSGGVSAGGNITVGGNSAGRDRIGDEVHIDNIQIGSVQIINQQPGNPPTSSASSYPQDELTIKTIHYEHSYKDNGDFEGTIIYTILNNTRQNLTTLIPARMQWSGVGIKYEKIIKVVGNEANTYNMSESLFNVQEHTSGYLTGKQMEATTFSWFPEIHPPVAPQQQVSYAVTIKTQATEQMVFSDHGSFAGMESPLKAEEISCRINAPAGFRTVLLAYFVRDSLGVTVTAHVPEPRPGHDGSYMEWRVADPVPQANYILNIRIEKQR